jgi:hypothetical protein
VELPVLDNKYIKLLKGTIITAAIIWGIYELPHGFLLLFPIGASIWTAFFTLSRIEHVVEVTHLIGLVFFIFMPMLVLEIYIIFSLINEISAILLHFMAFLAACGWYSWVEYILEK